jgi:hypothetical protein
MTWVIRRVLVPLVGVVAFGSILTACAGAGANTAVGTSGEGGGFVAVDTTSPPMVNVENRTDGALVDVTLSIKSGMLTFTDRVSRLEAKEKRSIRHGDFTSRDGTSFNLRVARPKEVAVSAKNLEGKTFEATVPWQ